MEQRQDRTPTTEETNLALSLSIDELPCSRELYRYLRKHGVAYLGEACRLKRAPQFQRGVRKTSVNWEELKNLLAAHGLKPGSDPVAMGWRPPYWNNPEWVAALSTPLAEAGDFPSWFLLKETGKGNRFIGQLIRSIENEYLTNWAALQGCWLGSRRFDLFRTGMVIPPDWSPMTDKERAARAEVAQKTLPIDVVRTQVALGLAASAKIGLDMLPLAVEEVMRAISVAGGVRMLLSILAVPAANEQLAESGAAGNIKLSLSEVGLDILNLSTKTWNALEARGNIHDVSQLVSMNENDLHKVPRVGRKGIQEINKALAAIGLGLKK